LVLVVLSEVEQRLDAVRAVLGLSRVPHPAGPTERKQSAADLHVPGEKSLNGIRAKVRAATRRQTTSLPAAVTFRRLGQITRGWALYFRHGSSSRAFAAVQHHLWWTVWRWLRKKDPNRNAAWIIAHYYGPGQWWPKADGVHLFQPSTVKIERYRFRGTNIPTPWPTQAATA
jgi:RNA-directed DNA polymerase